MEVVVVRGDRRIGKVIYDVFRLGVKFDGWVEYFNLDIWKEVMEKNNFFIDFYVYRNRNYEEVFFWDYIDVGISKKFLIREDENVKKEKIIFDCRYNCNGCGINIYDIGRGFC